MSSMTRFTIRPLYLQVRDMLVERIMSGQWKPGAAIANEVELSRELGVSVGTIRKALDVMEQERLITRRQGRGTYVNDHTKDSLATRFNRLRSDDGDCLTTTTLTSEMKSGRPTEEEVAKLQLAPGESVIRIRRIQVSDQQQRIMLEHVALPESRFPGLTTKKNASQRIVALAQQYGLLLRGASEKISVMNASAEVAEALAVEDGTPLLTMDRVVTAIDGAPVEWRFAQCHLADGAYYSVEMD